MEPVDALDRIADLLVRGREPTYKAQAFRRAAREIKRVPVEELRRLDEIGRLQDIPGVGDKSAAVISEALAGETPQYLQKLLEHAPQPGSDAGEALRAQLKGDLHGHSDWSDGGHTIRAMAEKARDIGHEYFALTDHSPRLKIANGLSRERLLEQLDVVAGLNEEFAPFRILTGVEVDILEDGALDHEDDMLARVDIVVASVHSKLRMDGKEMTRRMVRAISHPQVDVLGHCTGRLLTGRGRPQSEFDHDVVLAALDAHETALEVNSRPERLDPPKEMLRIAVSEGLKLTISTDAHATDQLDWQAYGTDRAADCGAVVEQIVNSLAADELLAWSNSRA